jgi:hypothetical protein
MPFPTPAFRASKATEAIPLRLVRKEKTDGDIGSFRSEAAAGETKGGEKLG